MIDQPIQIFLSSIYPVQPLFPQLLILWKFVESEKVSCAANIPAFLGTVSSTAKYHTVILLRNNNIKF